MKSFKKISKVLDCFTRKEPRNSLNTISKKTGIPKGTVHRLLKGLKDPEFETLDQVDEFYSKATPSIVDKILIGIYRCMAWTKEDQANIADQFPEQWGTSFWI